MDFFKRSSVKAIILGVLTVLTSISTALLGDFNANQPHLIEKWFFLAITAMTYLIISAWYAVQDVNDHRISGILKKQNDAYEDVMANIISICQNNSSNVNACIHNIIDKNTWDQSTWNFKMASRWVCEHVYQSISVLCSSKDFEVVYVHLVEESNNNEIEAIAYANQSHKKPSILNKKRSFKNIENEGHAFFDLKLFSKNASDVAILLTPEMIESTFAFTSVESRAKHKGKYEQYIGVPVFCDNRKMVGLLEMVSFSETKFGLSEKELEEVANKYLVPYANLILLLHKIEKALLAKRTPIS